MPTNLYIGIPPSKAAPRVNILLPKTASADAVFGSRMLTRGAALDGGMPMYKFVGNKILTAFQNKMMRSALSEFHSGYRLYSVSALKQIPFRLNTNVFHFDTEIIYQLIIRGLQIKERARSLICKPRIIS